MENKLRPLSRQKGGAYIALKESGSDAYLEAISSETVRHLRPLARRRARTLRPFLVAMRSRKPCLLTLLRFEGWNVLFIAIL